MLFRLTKKQEEKLCRLDKNQRKAFKKNFYRLINKNRIRINHEEKKAIAKFLRGLYARYYLEQILQRCKKADPQATQKLIRMVISKN